MSINNPAKVKLNDRNGTVIVDAAICIPIFVIALVILMMLVAQCGHEAGTFHEMTDYAGKTVEAIAAAGSDSVGIKVELDNGLCVDNILVITRSVKTKIPVPDIFLSKIDTGEILAFRPFIGESKQSGIIDNTKVYIFPKRGECYHVLGCPDMQDGCIQSILTDKVRRSYRPCKNCKPESMASGSVVYLYSAASRVYHRKECPSITKIYVGTTKSEAVAQGYRPCSHCGGGELSVSGE